MAWPGSRAPERGALLKPSKGTTVMGQSRRRDEEALRWTCNADSSSDAVGREYPARLPWDTLGVLAVIGLFVWLLNRALVVDEIFERRPPGEPVFGGMLPMVSYATVLLAIAAVLLSPRRVRREVDSFVIVYPLFSCVVPIKEVLELVMVSGLDDFIDVLARWSVIPFGCCPKFFLGAPSGLGAACTLLTSQTFWSYYFCLEDPIKFLVDNQKPLDLGQRYKTLGLAIVREGESLSTKRVCTVKKGSVMRIERQSGRRVYVHFEGGNVSGWMSYINQLGHFLVGKENSEICPAAGTVGASEFTRSYGATIELPTMQQEGEEE